jgi:hypothetical protein
MVVGDRQCIDYFVSRGGSVNIVHDPQVCQQIVAKQLLKNNMYN